MSDNNNNNNNNKKMENALRDTKREYDRIVKIQLFGWGFSGKTAIFRALTGGRIPSQGEVTDGTETNEFIKTNDRGEKIKFIFFDFNGMSTLDLRKGAREMLDEFLGSITKSRDHLEAFYYVSDMPKHSSSVIDDIKKNLAGFPKLDSKAFNRVLKHCGSDLELSSDCFKMIKHWNKICDECNHIANKHF